MLVYKGIRYATAERFGKPRQEAPLTSLNEVETAIKICPQSPSRLDSVIGKTGSSEEQSEDCLRLAVFTPSTEGRRPVLVWIHGGAYLTGSSMYDVYDASDLSSAGNIVVVGISYRLGSFGFLYDPENEVVNLGVEDQVCALRWIRDNITLFGGDPENVTIFGQSAGGYSVLHHIANVKEPLFKKAIVASAPFAPSSRKTMRTNTKKWYKEIGTDPKSCPVERMLEAQGAVAKHTVGGMPFTAVCDDITKPSGLTPGLKAVKMWCQKDDALPFVPFRFLTDIVTAVLFRNPMARYASHMRSMGVEADFSVRDWRHGDSPFGAVHCMELPLLFGNYETWRNAPFMQGVSSEEHERVAQLLRSELFAFCEK